MAAFKEALSKKTLPRLARAIAAVHPAFDEKAFLERVFATLARHELKGRVDLIARALRECLPADYPQALALLVRSLDADAELEGFLLWPHAHYVLLFGTGPDDRDFEASMRALERITERFTGEFAIRPFLRLRREKTLARVHRWTESANVHHRRLASEGTRPLLPWGERLPEFFDHPEWGLAVLEKLRFDPDEYVRKSVANHLNDFSKRHPDLVIRTLARWLKESPDPSRKHVAWIARHASRTLLKKGHAGAMKLQGLRPADVGLRDLRLSKRALKLGDTLEARFTLVSREKKPSKLMIDYAVHHRKANGKSQAKVFKHAVRTVGARESIELRLRHPIREITTRKYYSGAHAIEILVNGRSLGRAAFTLKT